MVWKTVRRKLGEKMVENSWSSGGVKFLHVTVNLHLKCVASLKTLWALKKSIKKKDEWLVYPSKNAVKSCEEKMFMSFLDVSCT